MRTPTLSFFALTLAVTGCNKPAPAAPAVHDPVAPSGGPVATAPKPSPPVSENPKPAPAEPAALTVPDSLKSDAYTYYGLGMEKPQTIKMEVTQPGADGKPKRTEYAGTRTLMVRSVAEGRAEFVETQTGGPEGDMIQTVSITPDGLFLEDLDPGKLKNPHQLQLPANAKPGDTWKARFELDLAGKALVIQATYKAVGMRDVGTKSGKRPALYVTEEGSGTWGKLPYTQREEWWYVKGVGPVKESSAENAGGRKFTAEIEIVE